MPTEPSKKKTFQRIQIWNLAFIRNRDQGFFSFDESDLSSRVMKSVGESRSWVATGLRKGHFFIRGTFTFDNRKEFSSERVEKKHGRDLRSALIGSGLLS